MPVTCTFRGRSGWLKNTELTFHSVELSTASPSFRLE